MAKIPSVEQECFAEIARLRARIAELETQPATRWRRGPEELPAEGVKVLTYVPADGCPASWEVAEIEDGRWFGDTSAWLTWAVTYWMPLPAPPEVKP